MDGLLVIDKPEGITSHDVVSRVRRILNTKRVGHTGTLDPFATGVMVILVGSSTRLAQFLDKDEKEYEAVIRFGYETDTGDRTGKARSDDQMARSESISLVKGLEWNKVLQNFLGESEQTPPMFSAKKIEGKKLYEHARRGEVVERKPIRIHISKIELLHAGPEVIKITVACSAGTYVRTLSEDIGRSVGLGAHLVDLRRTRSGRFSISQAISLDVLREMDDPASALLRSEMAVAHLPEFIVPHDRIQKTRNGLSTRIAEPGFVPGRAIRMLGQHGELIAIGIYNDSENSVQPKVVLL
jgi:tRNA pseudouridine55 synthase